MMELHTDGVVTHPVRPAFWQRNGYLQTHLDFVLREISPALSLKIMQARVIDIISETADTKTYALKMPRRWRGFTAGMYLPIGVFINGALIRRNYSLSSSPEHYRRNRMVTITVKRVAGGLVSNWLFEHLQVGQWLQIGDAAGSFTLKQTTSEKVLLLAAGSGITPLFSMLNALEHHAREMTLIYYCRHAQDVIFAEQLANLHAQHSKLRLVVMLTDEHGRIHPTHLQRYCADVSQRDVLLCGPDGFMTAAMRILAVEGVADNRIFRESFGIRRDPSIVASMQQTEVSFVRSTLQIKGDGSKTVLELAEQAGLKPKHGCRGGLCHECTCTKLSGQVIDVRNGKKSRLDQEEIQVCISIPQGVVEIAL